MGKSQHPTAKLIPTAPMTCPCCLDREAFQLTYSHSTSLDRKVLLDVKKNCRCRIPEQEVKDLAQRELARI